MKFSRPFSLSVICNFVLLLGLTLPCYAAEALKGQSSPVDSAKAIDQNSKQVLQPNIQMDSLESEAKAEQVRSRVDSALGKISSKKIKADSSSQADSLNVKKLAKSEPILDSTSRDSSSNSMPSDSLASVKTDSVTNSDTLGTSFVDSISSADSSFSSQTDSSALLSPSSDTIAAKYSTETDSAGSNGTSPKGPNKERQKIVRETTVHTIDDLKGRYRSPKRALFFSLAVPGAGQAYVGHWVRGSAYFMADIAMFFGWHHYTVVKHDRQVKRYKKYADTYWRNSRYEEWVRTRFGKEEDKAQFNKVSPHRYVYCGSLVDQGQQAREYEGCNDIWDAQKYSYYAGTQNDGDFAPADVDSVTALRSRLIDAQTFYEVIGKENEFVAGWDDANLDSITVDENSISGNSEHRQNYRNMRAKATDYSRMQAYFLGGIVLNHLVSAVDAALAAQFHNKKLYQTETRWYHRVRMDAMLALNNGGPEPMVRAYLPF